MNRVKHRQQSIQHPLFGAFAEACPEHACTFFANVRKFSSDPGHVYPKVTARDSFPIRFPQADDVSVLQVGPIGITVIVSPIKKIPTLIFISHLEQSVTSLDVAAWIPSTGASLVGATVNANGSFIASPQIAL
jgi:hypothetical protein